MRLAAWIPTNATQTLPPRSTIATPRRGSTHLKATGGNFLYEKRKKAPFAQRFMLRLNVLYKQMVRGACGSAPWSVGHSGVCLPEPGHGENTDANGVWCWLRIGLVVLVLILVTLLVRP